MTHIRAYRSTIYAGLLISNLGLAVLLWLQLFTDYSWRGSIPDILFPPAAACISLFSLALVALTADTRFGKALGGAVCLPPLVGGCLPTLTTILLLPVTFLGMMFTMDEIGNERLIQSAPAPSGRQVAQVYFRPVGAYSGGSGRVFIRLVSPMLPFLERDVYYVGRSLADEDTQNYVEWRDDHTLFISETQRILTLTPVRLELPQFVRLPLVLVSAGAEAARAWPENAHLMRLVRRVPAYPGIIEHNEVSADAGRGLGWRSYQLTDHNPSEVARWYEARMSEEPWNVTQFWYVDVVGDPYEWEHYCIQATYGDSSGEKTPYTVWISQARGVASVFVDIGTPQSRANICNSREHNP